MVELRALNFNLFIVRMKYRERKKKMGLMVRFIFKTKTMKSDGEINGLFLSFRLDVAQRYLSTHLISVCYHPKSASILLLHSHCVTIYFSLNVHS